MATGKGNAFITKLLQTLFQNANMANHGDATGIRGSSTAGSYYLSLHTADPGVAGTQQTSEAAYTSYARVAVARSAAGFTVTNQTVTLAATASFPAGTGGGETCTYACIGTSSTGAGEILYKGTLSPSLATGNTITPQITTATGFTEA